MMKGYGNNTRSGRVFVVVISTPACFYDLSTRVCLAFFASRIPFANGIIATFPEKMVETGIVLTPLVQIVERWQLLEFGSDQNLQPVLEA